MFKKMFGTERCAETGVCRKLHNEEDRNLQTVPVTKYYYGDQSKRYEMGVHVARTGE
jgi:hypothetical protein